MYRNGKPVVPPVCPNKRFGEPFDIPGDRVIYTAHDCDTDSKGNAHTTEIFFSFLQDNNDLATDSLVVAVDSEIAEQAFRINPTNDAAMERMSELFCERIANCRGILPDGQCWALGSQAVEEVVLQVADEYGEDR